MANDNVTGVEDGQQGTAFAALRQDRRFEIPKGVEEIAKELEARLESIRASVAIAIDAMEMRQHQANIGPLLEGVLERRRHRRPGRRTRARQIERAARAWPLGDGQG